MQKLFLLILISLFILFIGCTNIDDSSSNKGTTNAIKSIDSGAITTFNDVSSDICTQDGKPIIRVFSTTNCPHCKWIKSTIDAILKEYRDAGKIIAYHWEFNTKDDSLTIETEAEVPAEESNLFLEFNPHNTVPTYIFGCKYVRVGNGHERQKDLLAEEAEFRAVIESLIIESKT